MWPHVYGDDGGMHANDDGIHVEGNGHVVCHNRLVGFGDALKTEQDGARAVDFYGNEVLSAYDNGLELDGSEGNIRAFRNRFTNTYATISFQPIFGGPAYAFRNVVVNVVNEQMKFHGLGTGSGPSGMLVYHNTFVSPDMALALRPTRPVTLRRSRTTCSSAPRRSPARGPWTGPDRSTTAPSTRTATSRTAVSASTSAPVRAGESRTSRRCRRRAVFETNGQLLAPPIFASGLTAPAGYTGTLMPPQDVTLEASSERGRSRHVLPNLNDGFTGAAPDLGALERGCPLPIYGVRPQGIDETNEPFGCAP